MSVPAPRRSHRGNGWWKTIRYAIDSSARTFRFRLILLVMIVSLVAASVAAVLIHLYREVLRLTEENQRRVPLLSNLAAALRLRFERAGEAAELDEAVTLPRQATDTIPSTHPRKARFESLLETGSVQRAQAGVI